MIRADSTLLLDGQLFRFVGPNSYWLGQGDDGYSSHVWVDDALATTRAMGATVVRAPTLGISTGRTLCVEPTLGHHHAVVLTRIDYFINTAYTHGLRLIVPLTDNRQYHQGGKHTFTTWRGIADENEFYTTRPRRRRGYACPDDQSDRCGDARRVRAHLSAEHAPQ